MKNKNYVRITTILLSGTILLKVFSIFVLLCSPFQESSALVDLVAEIYINYPSFFILFNIPFPILYIYWGARKKIGKEYAFNGALFSILQIILGLFVCFLSLASVF